MDSATISTVRCHLLVRSLVYWARTRHSQEYKNTYYNVMEVPFIPNYYRDWSNKRLHIVSRPILKQICAELVALTEPDDLARLHFQPVWFVLEGLDYVEQATCLHILKDWYGKSPVHPRPEWDPAEREQSTA